MKRFVFLLMIGFVLLPHPVWAEMYRYKDAGGVVRFTDNLADVPEKQRAGVAVYENTPAPAAPSAAEQPSSGDALIGQASGKKPQDDSASNSPQSEELLNDPDRIDQFLKIKTALDEENAQIVKESLALSEERKTISGNAAINAYNEKISALNIRVDDYEKRRAAFQKEADIFDVVLKNRLAPPPPQPPQSPPP